MIKVGIVGSAGYSGAELIKLLLNHPYVEINKLFGNSTVGTRIEDVHTSLRKLISIEIEKFTPDSLENLDLIFVALPSGQTFEIVSAAYHKKVKVIDIGGDFRLKKADEYSKYYKHEHTAVDLLNKSVYGLCEWNEDNISKAEIVANPGCYPTSILLALIPMIKYDLINNSTVSIVSYSGTTGAGKSVVQNMIFSEVNENVRAYKVGSHQHIPEIKQALKCFGGYSPAFSFVPHLLPVSRGIYTTIHAHLKIGVSEENLTEAYSSSYDLKPFVRFVNPSVPEMKDTSYTNFCDIGFKMVDNNSIVVFSTLDNLVKGAAGQAIQNMNILFGLKQETGLTSCNSQK